MKYQIFSIYDSQTELFEAPVTAVNKGDFIRQWSSLINDGQSRFAVHSSDFSAFHIADFESSTGEVTTLTSPVRICYAKELIIPKS
jgi:hypothetical protein